MDNGGHPLTGWRIQRARGESLAFRGVGPLRSGRTLEVRACKAIPMGAWNSPTWNQDSIPEMGLTQIPCQGKEGMNTDPASLDKTGNHEEHLFQRSE